MKKIGPILMAITLMITFPARTDAGPIPYTIPDSPWEEGMGNHRAIIQVPSASNVAHLNFEWRRHDALVSNRQFIIVNSSTNQIVKNIFRKEVNNEHCELLFGPVDAGIYYFYYLPYKVVPEDWGSFKTDYLSIEPAPDAIWVTANNLSGSGINIIEATCSEVQARTAFDSFYPMEVIATEAEKYAYTLANGGEFLIFTEDRQYPIRMLDNIPQKWLLNPPSPKLTGNADKNEYYTFQLGLWACKNDVSNVTIEFGALVGANYTLSAASLTCFNTGGIDPSGKPFSKTVNVPKSKVQPLWIGVDLPKDIPEGKYAGKLTIKTGNSGQKEIDIVINVSDIVLDDRGDSDAWRHSRLRWLNSSIGIDDNNVLPYSPIRVINDKSLDLSGKEIILSESGLPASIKVYGEEVLSAPIVFSISSGSGPLKFTTNKTSILKQTSGVFTKEVEQVAAGAIKLITRTEVESDGWVKVTFDVEALNNISLSDIELDIPYKKEASSYIMGMGLFGTETPDIRNIKWRPFNSFLWVNPNTLRYDNGDDVKYGPFDSFWLGSSNAGLVCKLRGASYMGPMISTYVPKPPQSWSNQGKGGVKINTSPDKRHAIVYTGNKIMNAGDKTQFECAFILTPMKKLDTHNQFEDRYYVNVGNPAPPPSAIDYGVKTILIFGADFCRYGNYPYPDVDILRNFVKQWQSKGLNVKMGSGVRILSNHATEIWALRSLGNEIFSNGAGGGYPWLREHLVSNYDVQWYMRFNSTDISSEILLNGSENRWYNYYVEGVKWLVDQSNLDGFYFDDISFGRDILKRVRKVVSTKKPDFNIDLHSCKGYAGIPALQYAEFYPYINKTWFGENFYYNDMPPSNWLTETSGIPFGVMGDMLQDGGNRYRGMVYGMSSRYPFNSDPRLIWRMWDDYGIVNSKMIGYWDKESAISTSNKDVLATTYMIDSTNMLVCIGSWAKAKTKVVLKFDFRKLGLDSTTIKITAPSLGSIQVHKTFELNDSISVDPTKGWMLLIEGKKLVKVEEISTTQIKIYPTLVSNHLFVEGGDGANIQIVNSVGIIIYRMENLKEILQVNTSGWIAGNYLILINKNGKNEVKKIVKI